MSFMCEVLTVSKFKLSQHWSDFLYERLGKKRCECFNLSAIRLTVSCLASTNTICSARFGKAGISVFGITLFVARLNGVEGPSI